MLRINTKNTIHLKGNNIEDERILLYYNKDLKTIINHGYPINSFERKSIRNIYIQIK